jgi:hypothetical protein
MEERLDQVVSPPTPAGAAEEQMFTRDSVREMVARAQRGEGAKRIARNSGWIARPSSVGSGWRVAAAAVSIAATANRWFR